MLLAKVEDLGPVARDVARSAALVGQGITLDVLQNVTSLGDEDLFDAMREFVRVHPQWDQYRLMQAALAGFLFQQGCQDRAVARHYLDGLFQKEGSPQGRPG
jgi:hypothetical protein